MSEETKPATDEEITRYKSLALVGDEDPTEVSVIPASIFARIEADAKKIAEMERREVHAQQLCAIYFSIAAEVLGEDEVRRLRDGAIAEVARRTA